MLKRLAVIVGVSILLASCAHFFPSDPGGRLGTLITSEGSAALQIPACPNSPRTVSSITVTAVDGDKLGRLLWKLTSNEPQAVSEQYILGDVPPGFTESTEWENSFVAGPVNVTAVMGNGITLTSDASFGEFQPGSLYISNAAVTEEDLQEQIYCGNG